MKKIHRGDAEARRFETADLLRRRLLLGALGLGAAAVLPRVGMAGSSSYLVAGRDNASGGHLFAWVDGDGHSGQIALPFRGHGLVDLGGNRALLIARRPGTQAAVVELRRGELLGIFDAGEQRHFYGHGVLSGDGQRLYTTEGDLRSGEGLIGVRDARSFAKLGELPARGIGPHDLRLFDDGSLLIAVGGIRTRGREKLNIDTMRPSLNLIDAESGALLARHELPHRQLSTRHLDVAGGHYAVACQWEGEGASPPLLALGKVGEAPELLPMDAAQRRMRGYAASVRIDPVHRRVAMTSPRGGVLGLWDLDSRALIAAPRLRDVCGLAHSAEAGFVATCGTGAVYRVDPRDGAVTAFADQFEGGDYWDNHALLIG